MIPQLAGQVHALPGCPARTAENMGNAGSGCAERDATERNQPAPRSVGPSSASGWGAPLPLESVRDAARRVAPQERLRTKISSIRPYSLA